jgi:hypothetical protein
MSGGNFRSPTPPRAEERVCGGRSAVSDSAPLDAAGVGYLPDARPLAKALITGEPLVGDAVKEVVAEAGEQLSDPVADVRAERTSTGTATPASTTEPQDGHSWALNVNYE